LQFAKIATYIFVFAYICKYSVFLRPSVYKIQCNFESGSVKFSVILKTHLATLVLSRPGGETTGHETGGDDRRITENVVYNAQPAYKIIEFFMK